MAERRTKGHCGDDDAACKFAADQAASNAVVQSVRDLVRLATNTSDADAYALAVYRCGVRAIAEPDSGDRALLSFAQWARIEPGNVIPWLYLANDAEQRHDQSTSEAALYRAARSQYSDPHWDQILELLSSDAVVGHPPAIERSLVVTLIGIRAALPLANQANLLRHCSADALREPNRAQTCGDLAATLIQHGHTAIDAAVGVAIVRKVGGTSPRLAALQDEGDALRWQMSQVQTSAEDMHLLSCDSLRRFRGESAERAQYGEAGQLRRALAASGVTTQQAAERWRVANRERMRLQDKGTSPPN